MNNNKNKSSSTRIEANSNTTENVRPKRVIIDDFKIYNSFTLSTVHMMK